MIIEKREVKKKKGKNRPSSSGSRGSVGLLSLSAQLYCLATTNSATTEWSDETFFQFTSQFSRVQLEAGFSPSLINSGYSGDMKRSRSWKIYGKNI